MRLRTTTIVVLIGLSVMGCPQAEDQEYPDNVLHRHEEREGLIGIELTDGRVGFVDTDDNLVIPFEFFKFGSPWDDSERYNIPVVFEDGLSPARNEDGNAGFIDTSGNWAIEPQYRSVNFFSNGLASVYLSDDQERRNVFINKNNEVVYGPFDTQRYAFFYFYRQEKYGIFRSEETGKYGIVNARGEETVPAIYDAIPNISEGRTFARLENTSRIIDMNNNVILEDAAGRHFINGTAIVGRRVDGGVEYGIVDRDGTFLLEYTGEVFFQLDYPCRDLYLPLGITDCTFGSFHPVVDGVVAAVSTETNRYGLYSVEGRWIVEPEYLQIEYVAEDKFAYRTTDNEYGFFTTTGEEAPPEIGRE